MENEMNQTSVLIETKLADLFSNPEPRKEFVEELGMKLYFKYLDQKSNPIEFREKHESWLATMRNKLQARPILIFLSVILAMLVISGIVYAFGRLSGYIPGFGFTNSSQAIYVLSEPVSQNLDDLNFQIKQAVSDEERFWIELQVENLVEEPVFSTAYIQLQDGSKVERMLGYSASQDSVVTLKYSFPALPADTTDVTLVIEDLLDSPITIPFTLRTIRDGELIPVIEGDNFPLYGELKQGLQLSLDQVVAASDRTIFQVSLNFDNTGVFMIGPWTVSMQDSEGNILPLIEITPDTLDRGKSAVYQTSPFNGDEKLVLTLRNDFQGGNQINLLQDFSTDPGKFIFDPGVNPQSGQTWQLDEHVQVGDFNLRVVGAELNSTNDITFEFEAQPNVSGVMLYANSPDIRGAQGGQPSNKDSFTSTLGFHQLPTTPIEIQIRSVYYSIEGDWQLEWTPPPAPTESSMSLFPTATLMPRPSPTVTASPDDPLYLQVKSLSDQYDAFYQQGSGWVHIVREQYSKVVEGQMLPPPYSKSDEWYQVDEEGFIQRSLYTDFNAEGTIIQQAATIDNYSVNFTFGGGGYNLEGTRQISLDQLRDSFIHAEADKSEISGEEVDCLDHKRCLLISVKNIFDQAIQISGEERATSGTVYRVWIDLESGLQFKSESTHLYEDGSEEVRTTRQVLLVEKLDSPPDDVVGILDRVVLP